MLTQQKLQCIKEHSQSLSFFFLAIDWEMVFFLDFSLKNYLINNILIFLFIQFKNIGNNQVI